jgi:hypothetical protein
MKGDANVSSKHHCTACTSFKDIDTLVCLSSAFKISQNFTGGMDVYNFMNINPYFSKSKKRNGYCI